MQNVGRQLLREGRPVSSLNDLTSGASAVPGSVEAARTCALRVIRCPEAQ